MATLKSMDEIEVVKKVHEWVNAELTRERPTRSKDTQIRNG